MSPTVVGIDGARGGWAVAQWAETTGLSLSLEESITSVTARLSSGVLTAAVVDMPIGLSSDGIRPADALARARLGVRRSTFFPTPVRPVLGEESWENANAVSRSVSGKGLSKQAWNLVPKVRELDEAWTPEIATLIVEGHPEVSFAQMAGGPLTSKKNTPAGRADRMHLLGAPLPPAGHQVVASCPTSWRTDAIDALALVWTARRFESGDAVRLGGEIDAEGRPMQLVI